MNNRIMLLSWTVPPETTGSAVIVGNLAKQFTRDEMVVAGERPYDKPPVAWKDDWPAIHYLVDGWPDTRRGIRWRRRAQFPSIVARTIRLVRQFRCGTILVVYPREEYLFSGYVAARVTRAKLYTYFHNTYLEQTQPGTWQRRFASWLQGRVFREARHTFLMSAGMEELYRRSYPDLACSVLVHSFNEDIPHYAPPPEPGRTLRLVLAGNVNESCREATVRACAAIANCPDTALTIVSGTPREELEDLGLMTEGVSYETVSRDLVVQRLATGDVVLLTHGFSGGRSAEEYRTIFPTRTIEALICGRPILAHAPPGCFLTRFLRHHRCALVVTTAKPGAIAAAIDRLRRDAALRARLVRNAIRTAEMFHAPRVAGTLRAVLQR